MSTSANPVDNPPVQSGGAAPTPLQPTSSHAPASPLHAAGAHSVNLPLPTPPVPAKEDGKLQRAILEYVKTLSDDDKRAFQSAPDIIECLQEMQHNGKPLISNTLTTRVEGVLQCIKYFMSSLGVFIQHSPEISLLVVGGLNCILTVG